MVIYAPDGEKWACEACLKGHRVTSCSHKDRQLYHVNKKGRPVSQCQHCRGLRKSRHSHVKCVCAEYGIDKENHLDKAFGRRCNCGQGIPCTCAAKREIDLDDLPKAAARNLTHRRVQSHGAKPVMPNRRSDSSVPRPQLGAHHPQLHRMNHAAHEVGLPYTIKKFTTSTPDISINPQRSDDNLRLSSQGPTSQPSVQTELSSSVPTGHWLPQSSSIDAGTPSYSSGDLLQPRLDTSFADNALSPGNPSRYSMNDFSKFTWQNLGAGNIYGQPSFAVSADQLGTPNYSDFGLDTPSYSQENTTLQTPQRLSTASMEQPALTHSPSNTASEAGSSAYPSDVSYANYGSSQNVTSFPTKDYFGPQGLDTVSESMGDTTDESFVYRMESASSMEDIFSAGPGPAEGASKSSESMEFGGMTESLANANIFSSTESGPSLVVPEFTGNFGPFSSPTSAGSQPQQQQPTAPTSQPQQFYEQSMRGSFPWDMSPVPQQQNMS